MAKPGRPDTEPKPQNATERLCELMMKAINPGLLNREEQREFFDLADKVNQEMMLRKSNHENLT